MTKYCSHCHRALPRTAFHHNRCTWDGRTAWCKRCRSQEQTRAYARKQGYTRGNPRPPQEGT
jgi:hypothetical protein